MRSYINHLLHRRRYYIIYLMKKRKKQTNPTCMYIKKDDLNNTHYISMVFPEISSRVRAKIVLRSIIPQFKLSLKVPRKITVRSVKFMFRAIVKRLHLRLQRIFNDYAVRKPLYLSGRLRYRVEETICDATIPNVC